MTHVGTVESSDTTVNDNKVMKERMYSNFEKMLDLCTESWTKSFKIDFKSSLSVLSLWTSSNIK